MKTTSARTWILIAVAAIVFAVFSPAIFNDFVRWADDANLLNNTAYRGLSPSHLRWMLTTFHWGHYQPLAWLSYAMDYRLAGLDPRAAHATNVLLHALNAVLFCLVIAALLRAAFGKDVSSKPGFWACCGAGALVFALHPLRVETVAWASTRGDLLCGAFWMLTVLAYVSSAAAETPRRRRNLYLAALGLFLLALLSRAWAITLPLVLLALDFYPLRRTASCRPGNLFVEKIPFLALSLGAAAAALLARKIGMGMEPFSEHGLFARLAQSAYGLCFYLWKTIVPANLSPLYLLGHTVHAADPKYFLCGLFVVGLSIALFACRRRWPSGWAAWLCYVITAAPVLGVAQSGWQLAADRYTYLPLLPLGALVAGGLLAARGIAVRAFACAVLVVWSALSVLQIAAWRDTVSLWQQALRVDPGNYVALNLLGRELERSGDLGGAGANYDEALRLDPRYIDAYVSRGRLRYRHGDLPGSEEDFDAVIRLNPSTEDAFLVRGTVRQARGNRDGAMEDYDMALLAGADPAPVLRARAVLFHAQGRLVEAIEDYSALLKLGPGSAYDFVDRGRLKKEGGDLNGALEDFNSAIRLAPEMAAVHVDRAVVRRALGDAEGALADCSEAIRLDPREPLGYFNRGILHAEKNNGEAARADFLKALEVAPPDWPYRAQASAALERTPITAE